MGSPLFSIEDGNPADKDLFLPVLETHQRIIVAYQRLLCATVVTQVKRMFLMVDRWALNMRQTRRVRPHCS